MSMLPMCTYHEGLDEHASTCTYHEGLDEHASNVYLP